MCPLFHAVAHGCAADMHQQALEEVYWPRVARKGDAYIAKKLGAYSDHLASMVPFFENPWRAPAAGLAPMWQAGVLNWAGFGLRALGRLREALETLNAVLEMYESKKDAKQSAIAASNLSELQLTLGDVADAVQSVAQSVAYADQSEDMFERMASRTAHAEVLHQAGQQTEAQALFEQAEQLQQENQPGYSRLYSLQGFQYCDLLLAQGKIEEVLGRAEYDLDCWENHFTNGGLLDFSLPKLTLGRAQLQQHNWPQATEWLQQAVVGLRKVGDQDMLPQGLLARAELYRHTEAYVKAEKDLQEVYDIAQPSGMRLHMTDYHLESARLGLAAGWEQDRIQAHVDAAAGLIRATGYHRRDAELAELHKA